MSLIRSDFFITKAKMKKPLIFVVFLELFQSMFPPAILLVFFTPASNIATKTVWYGIYLATGKCASILSTLITGWIIDHKGRSIVLYGCCLGIMFLSIGVIVSFWMSAFWILICCNFTSCLLNNNKLASMVLVLDNNNGNISDLSLGQFCLAMGAMLGPLVISLFYWMLPKTSVAAYIIFLIIFLGGALLLAMTKKYIIINNNEQPNTLNIDGFIKLLAVSDKKLIFTLILSQAAWCNYYEFMPVLAKTIYHFSLGKIGLLMSWIGLILMFTTLYIIPKCKSIGDAALFKVAVGIELLGFSLLLSQQEIFIWAAALLIAAADVAIYLILFKQLTKTVSKENHGKMVGLIYLFAMLTWCAVSVVTPVLLNYSQYGLQCFGIAVMAIILIITNIQSLILYLQPHDQNFDN